MRYLYLYHDEGLGGGLLEGDPDVGQDIERNVVGSLMIIEAESLQEVKDTISKDAFYKNNVVSG